MFYPTHNDIERDCTIFTKLHAILNGKSGANNKNKEQEWTMTGQETRDSINACEPFDERRIFSQLGKYLRDCFDEGSLNDFHGNMIMVLLLLV